MVDDKKTTRQRVLEKRGTLSLEEIETKSKRIMDKLTSMKQYQEAKTVMFYVDAKNEVQTRQAINIALAMGKRVVVPKTIKDHGLEAIEIKSLDELKPGFFGIMEPQQSTGIDPKEIDFIVVPGVAFDRNGVRIGYGGGYYDHFLPKLRPDVLKTAVAFELQILNRLDPEPHDVIMDIIITEDHIYEKP